MIDMARAFEGFISFLIACIVAAFILGGVVTMGGYWLWKRIEINIEWAPAAPGEKETRT